MPKLKTFPLIWFNLEDWHGYISSYEELANLLSKISKETVLNSYLHLADDSEDDCRYSYDFGDSFLWKNSDITFRDWIRDNLDKKELKSIGITYETS